LNIKDYCDERKVTTFCKKVSDLRESLRINEVNEPIYFTKLYNIALLLLITIFFTGIDTLLIAYDNFTVFFYIFIILTFFISVVLYLIFNIDDKSSKQLTNQDREISAELKMSLDVLKISLEALKVTEKNYGNQQSRIEDLEVQIKTLYDQLYLKDDQIKN